MSKALGDCAATCNFTFCQIWCRHGDNQVLPLLQTQECAQQGGLLLGQKRDKGHRFGCRHHACSCPSRLGSSSTTDMRVLHEWLSTSTSSILSTCASTFCSEPSCTKRGESGPGDAIGGLERRRVPRRIAMVCCPPTDGLAGPFQAG